MSKAFVIINENDRYYSGRDAKKDKVIFKKDIFFAKFFKEQNKAIFAMEALKSEHFRKTKEELNLKIASVKFNTKIIE